MRASLIVMVLLGACGAKTEKPLTDADCEAWVAKIRECPLARMSQDAKEREANLEWRLGGCKSAIAEKPSETDSLSAGLQRREVRCRTASTCSAFSSCTDKAHDDAVDEAMNRAATP